MNFLHLEHLEISVIFYSFDLFAFSPVSLAVLKTLKGKSLFAKSSIKRRTQLFRNAVSPSLSLSPFLHLFLSQSTHSLNSQFFIFFQYVLFFFYYLRFFLYLTLAIYNKKFFSFYHFFRF